MWLEADCNLTSGESLVRQFIYGKRFFREEFGQDNRILWLRMCLAIPALAPDYEEERRGLLYDHQAGLESDQ